jgi:hypothetical protein
MLEQNVDQINATRANLPAASAGLMFQAQTVFLDLKKLFVNGENFGRTLRARNGELVLGVGQDLVEMSSHYMSILARGCDSASGVSPLLAVAASLCEAPPPRENSARVSRRPEDDGYSSIA